MERSFNQSVSTLSFVPKMSDHGVTLTCRVENSLIPSSVLEKSIKLDIQCEFFSLEKDELCEFNHVKDDRSTILTFF